MITGLSPFPDIVSDSYKFLFQIAGKLHPEFVFRHYSRLARKQGFHHLYLIFSFDCDTPEDIFAAEKIYHDFRGLGIKATFAVPGQILLEGKDVFKRLSDQGACFLNHGSLPHAEKRNNRHWPVTFYDTMTRSAIADDIRDGDSIVTEVTGHKPTGFRAPHFGCIQKPEQLKEIHNIIKDLGYTFSTSTVPYYALRYGPVWDINGIFEFPLTGTYDKPLSILDSWGNIENPAFPVVSENYADKFIEMIDKMLEVGASGIINYYVDPAHVVSSKSFYMAMEYLNQKNLPTLHFNDAIALMKGV